MAQQSFQFYLANAIYSAPEASKITLIGGIFPVPSSRLFLVSSP